HLERDAVLLDLPAGGARGPALRRRGTQGALLQGLRQRHGFLEQGAGEVRTQVTRKRKKPKDEGPSSEVSGPPCPVKGSVCLFFPFDFFLGLRAVMARLQERYQKEIADQLAKKLGRTNRLSLPRLQKIVINMGVGKALQDKNRMEQSAEQLTQITGQKAEITKAKKAVSGFRLRENNEIGCRVTLRGQRMYEFLDRLISIALPRIRDFRGVNPKSFDGHGNYSLGLSEQMV